MRFINKFKATSLIALALILVACSNSSEKIVLISSEQDLSKIRENLSGNFKLTNNINLEVSEWVPFGDDKNPFTGNFDGDNFTISNLTITAISTKNTHVGLFANNSGTIKNLKLDNVRINVRQGYSVRYFYLGSLVGYNKGVVENIEVLDGTLFAENGNWENGNFFYVGGVIGWNESPLLDRLKNNLTITTEDATSTGGLIGYISNRQSTSINSLHNFGNIVSDDFDVGGIVGYSAANVTVINSSNSANISAKGKVGGLMGGGGPFTIDNSINLGNIRSEGSAGGLIGGTSSTNISYSYNGGDIQGEWGVGGLIGSSYSTVNISKSLNNGLVSSVEGPFGEVGGLIGRGSVVNIEKSTNFGEINSVGGSVGGLIGSGKKVEISNSTNYGKISSIGSLGNVGGNIGFGENINVNKSANFANISGRSRVGGIAGDVRNLISLTQSLSVGTVIETPVERCNIIGKIPSSNSANNAFHYCRNNTINGLNFGTKVTNKSTFNLAFFTTTLGWDTEIWDFTGLDIANGVYPTLKNMPVVEE
jgi:hypothetical protein